MWVGLGLLISRGGCKLSPLPSTALCHFISGVWPTQSSAAKIKLENRQAKGRGEGCGAGAKTRGGANGVKTVWVWASIRAPNGGDPRFAFRSEDLHFGFAAPRYKGVTGDLIISSHFLRAQIFILRFMSCTVQNRKAQPFL